MSKILTYFPVTKTVKEPRKGQVDVLKAIEKAFADGYKNVLLEASVGSGKSAIAIAAARYFKTAHIITPRKSLQDQYVADFASKDITLMKGRSSYPCTFPSSGTGNSIYDMVCRDISSGSIPDLRLTELTCSEGPCAKSKQAYNSCVSDDAFPCPYYIAIDTAQKKSIVIHNVHSFIFQAYFAMRFEPREIFIIDECHEIEGIVRDFASKKITIEKHINDDLLAETKRFTSLDAWSSWFEQFTNLYGSSIDEFGVSDRDRFSDMLSELNNLSAQFSDKFVPVVDRDPISNKTKFTFIPEQVGGLANQLLFNYGNKRLLMSGTIYNKTLFCRNIGLKEEETCFIRIGSSFPKDTRPIYCKKNYQIDTSHRLWDQNFKTMTSKISSLLEIFKDAKGLIHTPSYLASETIFQALKSNGRMMTHSKDNFQETLLEFYNSEGPKVLLSPTCQQGVDFKYDRARFQIVIRVPYANTSDPFVDHKVKKDFPWYNYQALVIFGQQIGRINRAEDDYGVTILMDERFSKFLSRNRSILPKWLNESIIYG